MIISTITTVLLGLQLTYCEREHKVHNIILYPQRYSWCQTTEIQQIVASPGYEPVTINNTVCVGACYSYSIPSTQPAEPGELIGPYCDSCQPVETKCYHVTLKADSKNLDGPRTFQKRVQIIKKCSCTTCGQIQQDCNIHDINTLELPTNLFTTNQTKTTTNLNNGAEYQPEIPELFHFVNDHNKHLQYNINLLDSPPLMKTNSTKIEQHYELTEKLIKLLKTIQNNHIDNDNNNNNNNNNDNNSYDKDQLNELIKLIQGNDSELNDKNLMEFVNYVNTYTDHNDGNDGDDDLELDLNRLKDVINKYRKTQQKLIKNDLKKYKLHHLGDEIHVGMNLEHLIKGPHHSMVLSAPLTPPESPSEQQHPHVEEKLNIDSDVLKPNHDGVVISYENHHQHNHHHHHHHHQNIDD